MPVTINGSGSISGVPGAILQVAQAVCTTQTSNDTLTYKAMNVSCAITPKSSSSKIFVSISLQMYTQIQSNVDQGAAVQLMRNGVQIFEQPRLVVYRAGTGSAGYVLAEGCFSIQYLDSPATTSSVTYSINAKPLLISPIGQIVCQTLSSPSVVTLMEVAA